MLNLIPVEIIWYCGFLSLVNCAASQDSGDSPVLEFVVQPSDVTVAEQSIAAIPCVAVSSSPVTYSWTHNGTPLSVGTRRYRLIKPDGNLTVINTTLHDAGEYRCIASNRFGSALSLKADVRIAYLYVSNPINNTMTAMMYSSVKFPMNEVNSFPKARFKWKVRRPRSNVFDVIADGEQNGRLLISLTGDLYIVGARSDDTGVYRCVVTNPAVEKEIAVNFALKVVEGTVDRQLSFLLLPATTEVTAGTARVALECIVGPAVERGSPQTTTIKWHKHDIELEPIHDSKYSYPNGGSSHHKLIINDVGINDSDWYSCIATTKSAVITSPQAQLIVHQKPVVPSLQPEFPPVIHSFVGTDVTIGCQTSAGEVTWYKNAVKIIFSFNARKSVLANGSLLLRNASHVDNGLYQVFARSSVGEVSSPPVRLDIAERPPLKPTTLASTSTRGLTTEVSTLAPVTSSATRRSTTEESTLAPVTSTPTRRLTTKESIGVPATSVPTLSTTENHVTHLHQKQSTAGSLVPLGPENKGKMLLRYGTVAGGVVFLLLVTLAVFIYKRQTRRRLRQGSIKLKSEPDNDSEEFEMSPVVTRATSPSRPISVRRLKNSESTQDLLQTRKLNERRVSLDSNDNQFIEPIDLEDHVSAHVNSTMVTENEIITPATQETSGEDFLCSKSEYNQIRTVNEGESDKLHDSGIEEETSGSLGKFFQEREHKQNKSTPLYATVNKSKNGNISYQDDSKTLDKSNDNVLAEGQVGEPLYHVLEEPGENGGHPTQAETGDDRVKTASFYQPLMKCFQGTNDKENGTDNKHSARGCLEELVSSSTGQYHSLTPPNHDNSLKDASQLTPEGDLNQTVSDKRESTYEPLILNSESQSHLLLNSERPRSITGIYQPLRISPDNKVSIVRCWSAPQQASTSRVPPEPIMPANQQAESEHLYQTVEDEDRCPLNPDDPGSSFPPTRRRTPRASSLAQRRTLHEPLYIAVQVTPSRSNRRTCHSEQEPRYSPLPSRKNTSALQPLTRGHQRNLSDGGRAFPLMVNTSDAQGPISSAERSPPTALPRHLGHRRNRSDIGLCPIDRSQENQTIEDSLSRRLTAISDSGVPRTPSLGALDSGEHVRSSSDTTHCRVHIGP